MRPAFKTLISIANDKRISDKNFRNILVRIGECERMSDSVDTMLKAYAQDAIYETERERYVH